MPNLRQAIFASRALRFHDRTRTDSDLLENNLRDQVKERDETIKQRDETIRKLVDDKTLLKVQLRNIIVPGVGSTMPPSWRDIASSVMAKYNVSYADICSHRKHSDLVWARHVMVYLLMSLTRRSTPFIARRLGGRDHTSILHANNRVKDEVARNSERGRAAAELQHELKQACANDTAV